MSAYMDRRSMIRLGMFAGAGVAVSWPRLRVPAALAQVFTDPRMAHHLVSQANALTLYDFPLKGIVWGVPWSMRPDLAWWDRPRIGMVADMVRSGVWELLDTLPSEVFPDAVRDAYIARAQTFASPGEFGWIMEMRPELDIGDRLEAMILRLLLEDAGVCGPDPLASQHMLWMAQEIWLYVEVRQNGRARNRSMGSRTHAMFDEHLRPASNLALPTGAERQDILVRALDWLASLEGRVPPDHEAERAELYGLVWNELDRTLTRNGGQIGVGYVIGDRELDPELTHAAFLHGLRVSPYVIQSGQIGNGFGHPKAGANISACRWRRPLNAPSTQYTAFAREQVDPDTHAIAAAGIDNPASSTSQGVPLL